MLSLHGDRSLDDSLCWTVSGVGGGRDGIWYAEFFLLSDSLQKTWVPNDDPQAAPDTSVREAVVV